MEMVLMQLQNSIDTDKKLYQYQQKKSRYSNEQRDFILANY